MRVDYENVHAAGATPFSNECSSGVYVAAKGFSGIPRLIYRGNVSFVLVVSLRARLFLFPVPCSLFPLYFPLRIRKQPDKSEVT